jgi:hypothetical protein
MITPHDASELAWWFTGSDYDLGGDHDGLAAGTPFHDGSSFGDQLERARLLYRDSEGHVVPPSGRITDVLHLQPDGKYLPGHTLWPHALVKRAAPSGPAPTPEPTAREVAQAEAAHERQQARRSRRDRIADRLGRLDGASYDVMRALYGSSGAQWLQTPRGRIWAVLPLTELGGKHRPAALSPAAWLVELADAPRPRWLDAALNQAEALERAAGRAWAATRPRTIQPAEET